MRPRRQDIQRRAHVLREELPHRCVSEPASTLLSPASLATSIACLMRGRRMSASTMITFLLCCAKATARFVVTVVLPSPGMQLVTKMTLGPPPGAGKHDGGAQRPEGFRRDRVGLTQHPDRHCDREAPFVTVLRLFLNSRDPYGLAEIFKGRNDPDHGLSGNLLHFQRSRHCPIEAIGGKRSGESNERSQAAFPSPC